MRRDAGTQGSGAVAIIRLSGLDAFGIAGRVFQAGKQRRAAAQFESHRIYHGHVRDPRGSFLDEVGTWTPACWTRAQRGADLGQAACLWRAAPHAACVALSPTPGPLRAGAAAAHAGAQELHGRGRRGAAVPRRPRLRGQDPGPVPGAGRKACQERGVHPARLPQRPHGPLAGDPSQTVCWRLGGSCSAGALLGPAAEDWQYAPQSGVAGVVASSCWLTSRLSPAAPSCLTVLGHSLRKAMAARCPACAGGERGAAGRGQESGRGDSALGRSHRRGRTRRRVRG